MRTYGTYAFEHDAIIVEMEAMATIRFKRVFERAAQAAADFIALAATPENAREIEWFMDRYPLQPKAEMDRRRLDTLARDFDRSLTLVAEILQPDYEPPVVALAEPARPYQLLPAAMLRATGGVLIGDELGLGKTIEAIVAISDEGGLPALVVTPTHLPKQFERQIKRFAPQLSTWVLKRGAPLKRNAAQDLAAHYAAGRKMPDVVITSYSKLGGWAQWLVAHHRPNLVVWDEVQEFRSGFEVTSSKKSIRNRAGLYIAQRAKRRIGLSGTPIHNHGSEIHPVMEVVLPGALGSRTEFTREWCDGDGLVKNPPALGSYLRERGIYLRRTKAEVGRDLPPLTISEQFVEADPRIIQNLQRSSRALELAKLVLSGTRSAFQSSGEFDLFLRQQTGLAKAPYVAAFVSMLLENKEPVVLYGWHHAVYDVWREMLKDFNPVFYTGRETAAQKEEALRKFTSHETDLFIISLRSGSGIDGLQYTGCSNVVFGELDWSPAVHEQGIGRVRRDGIETPVTAWFLVCEDGSDPQMAEELGVKRGQLEGIRDPQGGIVAGQTDPDAIKRLAADFLNRCGVALPHTARDDDREAPFAFIEQGAA